MKAKVLIAFVLVVCVAVFGALVLAYTEGEQYYACVGPGGLLRMVDGEGECRGHESPITWNETGPIGPEGDQGEPGQDGTTCSVTQNDGSATIGCTDGTVATVDDGQPGADGEQGPEGPPGVLGFYIKTDTAVAYADSRAQRIVWCDDGDLITGGGFKALEPIPSDLLVDNLHVFVSRPVEEGPFNNAGWSVELRNSWAGFDIEFEVEAICADIYP